MSDLPNIFVTKHTIYLTIGMAGPIDVKQKGNTIYRMDADLFFFTSTLH